MENFRKLLLVLSIMSGIVFTVTDANADKKNKSKKGDNEARANSFSFDKEALLKLEMQLIKDYLDENEEPETVERLIKIYYSNGNLFFEGEESIVTGNLDEYEFLFEYGGVIYYLVIE